MEEKVGAEVKPTMCIKLRVIDQNGGELQFLLRVDSTLGKLKKFYADRIGTPVNALRFMFDSCRINDNDTPEELEMEDLDIIEVYQEQIGGSH